MSGGNLTVTINNSHQQRVAISSKSYKIVSSLFMCALMAVVIVGNVLAIAAYWKAVRFRVVSRCFIINLAVTDLLVGLVVMPMWLHFMLQEDVAGSIVLYKVWVTMDITCATASICSLAIVSLDRYIIIIKPLSYKKLLSKPRAVCLIFLIWFYALVIALVKQLEWYYYPLLVIGLSFVIPVSMMLFAYVNIFKVAKVQAHRIRLNSLSKINKKRFDIELKATKTISIVIGAFLLCWVPFYMVIILNKYCPKVCNLSFELVIIVKWLHYANSSVNPAIYAMHNRDFRDDLRAIWKGHASKACHDNCSNHHYSGRGSTGTRV